jgi:hypothetical protein
MRKPLHIKEVKEATKQDKKNFLIFLMIFVDHFRLHQDISSIEQPFELSDEPIDALLASTIEYLCDELNLAIPLWVKNIPPLKKPWFVCEWEGVKSFALVESPVRFRQRKIFVLENFLDRA